VGYAISSLKVRDDVVAQAATVAVEIDHTYSGDLMVSLVDPSGEHHRLGGGSGSDNDLRGEFDVELLEA